MPDGGAWRRRSRPSARPSRSGRASARRSGGRRPRTTSAPRFGRLGQRESGTTHLEEAAAAFRAALEERTRERAPLQWAMAQDNLGNALRALGERERGAPDAGQGRLEEAVAAYRAALEEWTRERVPLQWATAQSNLGSTLRALGERESGTPDVGRGRLEEAVAAFREALEERTRVRVPLDWATTQNNLGNALATLGERTEDVLKLKEARDAIAAAFDGCMHAGQEHHRAYFEGRLSDLDRKIADLKQRPGA